MEENTHLAVVSLNLSINEEKSRIKERCVVEDERETLSTHTVSPANIDRIKRSMSQDSEDKFERYDHFNNMIIDSSECLNSKAIYKSSPSLKSFKLQVTPRRLSDVSYRNVNSITQNLVAPTSKWLYSPFSGGRKKKIEADVPYKVEFSVFRPLRDVIPIKNEKEFQNLQKLFVEKCPPACACFYWSQDDFAEVVADVNYYIEDENLFPERILKGSSGSYFVYSRKFPYEFQSSVYKIGVFKPKDEEPYGPLSPKWTKWLHRTFFPCCFGRSCLIPNLGYISEAAACMLDRRLLSYIVPHTEVVQLRAPTFYYSYWGRQKDLIKLPKKIGSLQCFLHGFVDANTWFKMFSFPTDISDLPQSSDVVLTQSQPVSEGNFKWSKDVLRQFREELDKLVILDFIMRNTDRGLDNWMIKLLWLEKETHESYRIVSPFLKIGAIDSGLAFPWKHPDEWRSFPFGWLFLPFSIIGQPFSRETRKHYLSLLTSTCWWEKTVMELKNIFMKDADFKERMWRKQLAFLKGQAFNVVETLKIPHTGPLELTRTENLLILDEFMSAPILVNDNIMNNAISSSIYDLENTPKLNDADADIQDTNDLTPLLLNKVNTPNNNKNLDISGFEYNVNCDNNLTRNTCETNVREVVIERLVREKKKPPLLTWC